MLQEQFFYLLCYSLKKVISDLKERGVTVHFSEVKGPVMDILQHCHFIEKLTGNIYIDQYNAYCSVKELTKKQA